MAPAINLAAFLVLGALALFFTGWIARLAITHWQARGRPRGPSGG